MTMPIGMPSAKYSTEIQKSFRRVDTGEPRASTSLRERRGRASVRAMLDERRDWIVWDGACGFCRRAVAWARARDRDQRFVAIPYQDVPPPFMTAERAAACR